jgi:hypothetical protein
LKRDLLITVVLAIIKNCLDFCFHLGLHLRIAAPRSALTWTLAARSALGTLSALAALRSTLAARSTRTSGATLPSEEFAKLLPLRISYFQFSLNVGVEQKARSLKLAHAATAHLPARSTLSGPALSWSTLTWSALGGLAKSLGNS